MTGSVSSGLLSTLRPIQDEVANALGVTASEVIGVPLAIAFLVRADEAGRFFVSGLSPDFATAAVESLGGHTSVGTPGATVLSIAEQVWSPPCDGTAVGFGPVALDPTAPTADPSRVQGTQQLTVHKGRPPERTRLERAEHLRATFSVRAERLADEVAPAVEWSIVDRTEGPARSWLSEALTNLAVTRSTVGSYLIDQADELDDERIDQLGDGYVRCSQLWRDMAGGELTLGPEIHELERSCVSWMRSAAARPTRYAF